MNKHEYKTSDPAGWDSNCAICGGKKRDAIHNEAKSRTCEHRAYQCFNGGQTICKDCGEVFKSPQELRATRRPVIRQDFNEADCGGVFGADGQVHSDADPGL